MIIYKTDNSYFDTEKSEITTFSDDPKEAWIKANGKSFSVSRSYLYSDPAGVAAYQAGDLKEAKKYLLSMCDLTAMKWGTRNEGTLHYMEKWHADRKAEREEEENEQRERMIHDMKKHGTYNRWKDQERSKAAEAREAAEHNQMRTRYSRLVNNMHDSGYYIDLYSENGGDPIFILKNCDTNDWDDEGIYAGKDGSGRFTLAELETLFPGKD